jgi:hypothetical protein
VLPAGGVPRLAKQRDLLGLQLVKRRRKLAREVMHAEERPVDPDFLGPDRELNGLPQGIRCRPRL